ncbi:hypothetical protein [Candidatus Hodgkinia cicadicola]|uniref:hypothetical protein n=1 Tax=Candidatus Hodgkinia cicadicola TaxID=573658 RepID=UPI001788BE8C
MRLMLICVWNGRNLPSITCCFVVVWTYRVIDNKCWVESMKHGGNRQLEQRTHEYTSCFVELKWIWCSINSWRLCHMDVGFDIGCR